MEKVKIDDVLKYEQPTKYIVETENYDDSYNTPVLTAGKSFLLGYTNEEKGVFNEVPVIIFDDFTTSFHFVDFPFKVKSSALKILKAVKDKADIKYLYYKMQTIKFEAEQHKRYWISKYSQIEIPLPSIATQQRIAAILDQADAIIQNNRAIVQKYDALTQSLFLEMFGDPVKNEKGWEKKEFSKVAINENSKRIPVKQSDRDEREGEYPYYGATGIIDTIDDYKFDGEYLLIAEDGKNLLFRKKNNAFMAYGKFWVNNHAHILSCNNICNLKYLEFFLNSIDLSPFISGIDQIKLNKASLDRIPVIVPPIELQNQFAERVAVIEAQKQQAQLELAKSEELFASLLQRAFKGELN